MTNIQRQLPINNMYRPKMPPVENMCARCPFKPDGTGYGVHDSDLPDIITKVALGLPFPCHETFAMDQRTDTNAGMNQPHVRSCLGAVLYKQGKLALSDEAMKTCENPPAGPSLMFVNTPLSEAVSGRKRRSQRSKTRRNNHKRTKRRK